MPVEMENNEAGLVVISETDFLDYKTRLSSPQFANSAGDSYTENSQFSEAFGTLASQYADEWDN